MKVMAAVIGMTLATLFSALFSAEGDAFYAELNRLRTSAWQHRAESIAKVEALRQTKLDDLHGFCLESAACEILAKSRANTAEMRQAHDEARQHLKLIHDRFPAFSRHPYRLFLDLKLLPDRDAEEFPSAEVMAQVEALLRERFLDQLYEPEALRLDRTLGHQLGYLCEARQRKDLLRAGARSQEGRLEVLVGMLTLERLQAWSAPAWLLSSHASRTKAHMNSMGFLEGDKATLTLLDAIIAGRAPTTAPAVNPTAANNAKSEEDGKSPWDRPWLVLIGLLALVGGGVAWALGSRGNSSDKKP